MVNPEFVSREGMQLEEEGCLSVPGFNATVVRPMRAVVKGLNRSGADRCGKAQELLARAFQHEMDHLDGTAVHRSPARNQARHDRPADSQADARGQMVDARPVADRLLRNARVCRAHPRGPARLATCRRRRRHPAGPAARPRAEDHPLRRSRRRRTAAGVTVLQPDSMKDPGFVAALSAMNADLGVVAAYGKILTDAVLAVPRLGMVNVHASLLPRYRGAAPVHRAIIAGERETGITIMRVVKALDAGPMLATAHRADRPGRNQRGRRTRPRAHRRAPRRLDHRTPRRGPGPGTAAERCRCDVRPPADERRRRDRLGTRPAEQIHNRIRGLHPWPHAFTFLGGSGSSCFARRRRPTIRGAARLEPSWRRRAIAFASPPAPAS